MKKILLLGGAGYIGSHTYVELIKAGYDVLIVDNYSNSKPAVLKRLEQITGQVVKAVEADVCDADAMTEIFSDYKPDGLIHFAGYKAVGESVAKPLEYYRNNLDSTFVLLECMRRFKTDVFVFSSSATVYGVPKSVPITEDFPLFCTNPYGWTKYMNEQILRDMVVADPELSVVLLRYFNPVGAHCSGLIGEDPKGIPNNLMPYISQVAVGKLEKLHVFGDDYPTPDGTGVRDYIHVVDLAKGHVSALNYAFEHCGTLEVNLGTGEGYSVLDMVKAFEQANNVQIPYQIDPRRPGDIAECYADTKKAKALLHWQAELGLEDMCRDTWNWQMKNPEGYQ